MTPLRAFCIQTLIATVLAAAVPSHLSAQAGDAKDDPGTVQDAIWRDMDVPPAPIVSPEDSLDHFYLPDGYALELVAAEPLVNDPVAITWDEFGRLWVAEMWAYMPDPDGTGEDQPVSRVVVLEDLDQDGQMDRSTVFLDQLVMPRAVAIVDGGVLIADPPNLLYCQDLDGDLQSDKETKVLEYAATGNVEHAENGLMRGLDNWLYNAKSDRRIKFENGEITVENTLFRGQWGITMDDWGRLYYNTNSFYLYGDMVPSEYVSRHPGWEAQAGLSHKVVPDRSVLTARINPGINRAYREEYLRPDNRMRHVDAASDPEIFRGNRYPEELRGSAAVPDPAGQIVSLFKLQDDGLNVDSEKILQTVDSWGEVEFIASTDERFRPVATAAGPDGFLYVVDMYRGIIQHKTYLTSFLRKQIIERGLENPVGLGRIYRLVHEDDSSSRAAPRLGDMSELEWVEQLESDNGWTRDTAQRLLVQTRTNSANTIKALKRLATSGSGIPSVHALWTLSGLDQLDATTAVAAFDSGDTWTQVHALRASESKLATAQSKAPKLWKRYKAALESQEPRLKLQAFHQLPVVKNQDLLLEAVASLDEKRRADPYFIDAVVNASHQSEIDLIQALAAGKQNSGTSNLIGALAYATFKEKAETKLLRLANYASELPEGDSSRAAIAEGLSRAMGTKKPSPFKLQSAPDIFANGANSDLAAAFLWPGKSDPNAAANYDYTDADLASIARGKPIYDTACAICHQANGRGQASLAPALAGSEWVLDSKKRLALVVGHGLSGPIVVNGEAWNSTMPPHASHPLLADEAITDLLNYIRSAWENNSEPFQPGEARAYLGEFPKRSLPWTAAELEKELGN